MFLGRALLLVVAGVSAWLSFGTVSVVNLSTMRVGVLPSAWLLAALVIVGAASAALWRVPVSALAPLVLTLLLWLPWLPFPVPAAFLIWSGPIELFVWAAAIGGVISTAVPWRLPATLTRLLGNPQRAPAVALVIGVICALAGAKALDTRIPNGDEPHYLIITQSLLLDGDLRIENNHLSHDYLPYYADLPRPDFMQRGVDGEIYSIHAPGLPALVAAAFAIDGYRGVVIFVAVLVAFGGALAWHAAWMVSGSAAAAWMGWAAVFFSAPVFFHAFTVYPDGVGALCAMAAVWLLVRLEVDATPVPRAVLLAVGTGLAILPWLHSRFVLVAAGFGLAVLLRLSARADRTAGRARIRDCAHVCGDRVVRLLLDDLRHIQPGGAVRQRRAESPSHPETRAARALLRSAVRPRHECAGLRDGAGRPDRARTPSTAARE